MIVPAATFRGGGAHIVLDVIATDIGGPATLAGSGAVLDQLPWFTAFPSDFFTFWPSGRLWTSE